MGAPGFSLDLVLLRKRPGQASGHSREARAGAAPHLSWENLAVGGEGKVTVSLVFYFWIRNHVPGGS